MNNLIDSGVDWLGLIPETWKVYPIGSLFSNINIKVSDFNFMPLSVTKTSEGIVPQMESVAKSDAHDSRKQVLINDFVINSRSDRKMSCGVSAYDGSVSLINLVLRAKGEIIPRYTHYLFKNQYFADEFYRWGHGIVADLWTTGWDEMKKISIPMPSKYLQNEITSFLDVKCDAIDVLINNLNKQIINFVDYKKSLISECVTKGLKSNKTLIDSDSYYGYIPYDWSLKKIKNIIDYHKDNAFIDGDWIESNYIESEGIRYLTSGNIGDGVYRPKGKSFISMKTFNELNCKFAYPGDLVISRLNSPYGRSCILGDDYDRFVLAVDNVIIKPIENSKFICYVTQTQAYQTLVYDKARGTAMKRISRSNLAEILIPIPSIDEQNEIVEYLDDKCSKIDRLIEIKQKKIEELNDYKKSLIYEYVTGKKQVA